MKKILFSSAGILLLAAIQLSAQTVTQSEAQTVATHFFREINGNMNTVLTPKNLSVPGQMAPSDAYFLFEPASGDGFVIVSGDKKANPILAFSNKNKFQSDNIAPQAVYMLETYEQQIQKARKLTGKADQQTLANWDALKKNTFHAPEDPESVNPLLTTTWDQGGPYNQFCPIGANGARAVTGCVATSMAQIMRYWNFPNGATYHQVRLVDSDFTDINNGVNEDQVTIDSTIWLGGGYDWINMPNMMTAASPTDIARLMLHAGFAVGMDYGVVGSGALTSDVPAVMHEHFGYEEASYVSRSSMVQTLWDFTLQESLIEGIPVIYRAPGHAWVLDGFSTFFGSFWYHMNWGWGGSNDGYYSLNALSVNGNNFNSDQCAVFGLVPPGCPVSKFSTGNEFGSYQVAKTITANSTISTLPFLNVTFDAGETIILTSEFWAPYGSNFTALIEGCGGDFFNPEAETENRSESTADNKIIEPRQTFNISPNPCVSNPTVYYQLKEDAQVSIQIFDLTGKLLATPLQAKQQTAGNHQFELGTGTLPAGMYFVALQHGSRNQTQRLIISR